MTYIEQPVKALLERGKGKGQTTRLMVTPIAGLGAVADICSVSHLSKRAISKTEAISDQVATLDRGYGRWLRRQVGKSVRIGRGKKLTTMESRQARLKRMQVYFGPKGLSYSNRGLKS